MRTGSYAASMSNARPDADRGNGPRVMTRQEWIAAYGAAWRGKDDAALAELFTEGGLYLSVYDEAYYACGGS